MYFGVQISGVHCILHCIYKKEIGYQLRASSTVVYLQYVELQFMCLLQHPMGELCCAAFTS